MRYFILTAVALALACTLRAEPTDSTARRILALTDSYFEALHTTQLETLLAPEFRFQPLGMMMLNKERFVQQVSSLPASSRAISRTWIYREVLVTGKTAICHGEQTAAFAEPSGDTSKAVYFYQMVWIEQGGAWKLLSILRTNGGDALVESTWNEVFRDPGGVLSTANEFLSRQVKLLKSGKALDIACGQGRNSLLLARNGWQVTAIDLSEVGLRITQDQAKREGLAIHVERASADAYAYGLNRWDLITLMYFDMEPYTRRIFDALRPGGMFIFEGFPDQVLSRNGVNETTVDEITRFKETLSRIGFEVTHYEDVVTEADWGVGSTRVVRIAARKP